MIPRSSKAVPIVSFVAVVAVCLLLAAGLQIHAAPRVQQTSPDLDAELRALIAQHNLTGDPAADREIPLGWNAVGPKGPKAECLAYIESVWTDMRPLSLRKKMKEMEQQQQAGDQ